MTTKPVGRQSRQSVPAVQ